MTVRELRSRVEPKANLGLRVVEFETASQDEGALLAAELLAAALAAGALSVSADRWQTARGHVWRAYASWALPVRAPR